MVPELMQSPTRDAGLGDDNDGELRLAGADSDGSLW